MYVAWLYFVPTVYQEAEGFEEFIMLRENVAEVSGESMSLLRWFLCSQVLHTAVFKYKQNLNTYALLCTNTEVSGRGTENIL